MYYIQLNSQVIAYEKVGEGRPVLLIHGNGGSHKEFDVLTEAIKDRYTVVAPDSRGHGESATPGVYHYQDMADDMINLINALELDKPVVVGYSDGGIVALLMAIKDSDVLSGIICCGANLSPKGLKLAESLKIKSAYKKTKNPLLKLMLEEPAITREDLNKITVRATILAGENDMIKESETREIAEGIKLAELNILKGEDHGSYICDSDKLSKYIDEMMLV